MTETDGPERMFPDGGRAPEPVVSCLCLTDRPDVVEPWQQLFARTGINLVPHVPTSTAMACALARHEGSAFTLAHVPNTAEAGGALSSLVPIRNVLFPPLVVMVDHAVTADERERLRLQGAAYIVERPLSNSDDAAVLRQLVHSGSWFKGTTDRIVVTDVLQMLAADRKSGMLTVGCAHGQDFHTFPWHHTRQCSGSERNDCQGWYGRLHVIDGQLIHAETPSAEGIVALADMIEIVSGTLRIHDIFLEPSAPNLPGSIPSSILNAVLLADDRRRSQGNGASADPGASGAAAASRPRAPSPSAATLRAPFPALRAAPPAATLRAPFPALRAATSPRTSTTTSSTTSNNNKPESIQPKRDDEMKSLEPLLSLAPGLYAAAKADPSGNVQDLVGNIDAESVCAVAAMCSAPLERISGLLGLGACTNWGFVNKKLSLYVQRSNEGFVALLGPVTKSPETTLKKLAKTLSDKR
jgi:Domain of unknown function (DUF4388)